MKLGDVTPNDLKLIAGDTIYKRGLNYYDTGMVDDLNYDSDEDEITVVVSGNYGDYKVNVWLEDEEIEAECDCPYDGWPCKHIVAATLSFINNKKDYVTQAKNQKKDVHALTEKIQKLSKEQLIEIVIQGFQKYPDFKRDISVRIGADAKVTLAMILKQIDQAFPSITSREYSPANIVRKLKTILISVEHAALEIKLEVMWKIADCIIAELNAYGMQEYIFEDFVYQILDDLVELLPEKDSLKSKKQTIISKLMDYYESGNCGIVDQIYSTAYELCTDKPDYQILIDKLKKKIKNASFKSYSQDLLADLYYQIGDEDAVLTTLENNLQYGSDYWRLARFWLEQGDDEKALHIVKDGLAKGEGRKTDLYAYMQKHFIKINDYDSIFQLFEEKINKKDLESFSGIKSDSMFECLWKKYNKDKNYSMLQKLLDLCVKKNDLDLALLKMVRDAFPADDFNEFETLLLTTLRDKYEQAKKSKQHFWHHRIEEAETLAEVYQYKEEYEKLMAIVKDDRELLEKYESELMPRYPEKYLNAYMKVIERFIGFRGRENYKAAAEYAKKVQSIYCSILKKPVEWKQYINQLKAEHRRLPALQDEFYYLS